MKLIVVGCGRAGSTIAVKMSRQGHAVVIVDRNPLAFDRLPPDFTGKMIVGPGIDEEILIKAGIQDIDAVIAVTKGDNTNIMIGQIAKFLYRVNKVMIRIKDPQVKQFYEEEIGLPCFCPTEINADYFIGFIKGEPECIS
jgi:trk system potassium uptake protein TrkA